MFCGELVGLFKRILYFILSLLLTIQSQGVTFLLVSSAYADEFDKQRDDCINKKSKVWDPALNRCMTKGESFEDRQSFRECEKIKDDYAKQRKCFDDNAAEMIGSLEPKKAGLKEMQKTAEAMGYIQMILEMIAKDGINNSCMSSKVMAISGIVGMGVDIYLSFFVEDELYNLQDKYAKNITKKKQIEKGTYEAQIEAFNYLQKEQETLISVDEKKIIAYGLMTGLNGVAMLLAIYEMTPFGAAGACTAAPPSEGVDVPEGKVADVDAGKKGAPDVEVPEGPEGPGPKGPEGPEPGPGPDKKKRFKEVATDVKDKKKVIDAFPGGKGKGEPPTPPEGPKGKFKEVAGDVKTKKKVIGAFGDIPPTKKMADFGPPPNNPGNPPNPPKRPSILDNPPGDFSPPPKSPGEPPKPPASLALGDPPSPPKKPDILNNPPGNVPPPPKDPGRPPKAPEPPGDPPRNPGDPGDPPRKPSAVAPKDPGDLPPAAPPGKPPSDPGPPPKDIDLEGPPSKALAKAPEPPVRPVEPVKPAGGPGKAAGGGDYIEANIETAKTKQKPLKELSDTDIDSMQLTRDQKNTLKNNKKKLAEIDENIRVKKNKFGKDVDVSDFQKQKARIEKQSVDFQNKSQIQEMAGGRTKKVSMDAEMENYNKQKAKYDADMDSYKQKKAEYDSYQSEKSRLGSVGERKAAIDDYKAKKAEFDNYQKQKIDYDSYKQQKAEFDNFQKQRADYDSYSQKKADYDGYAQESQSWKQKNQKYQADLEGFNQKQTKYEGDLNQYNKDYDTWQNQKSTLDADSPEFDAAKKKYDDDLANYEADMDTWTRQKKKAELDRANYNSKKAKYDTDMEAYQKDYNNWSSKKSGNLEFENAKKKYDGDLAKFDADMDAWTNQKKKYDTDLADYNAKKVVFEEAPISPLEPPKMTKTDPGPPPAPPKRPDILEKPPGDIPPPPKKPVDPGYFEMVYSDPPELPPSKVADFNQYGDFPRGGKAPELPSEPPKPPKGAADPGPPPPRTSPDYQKWEVRKEKFEARKKVVPEFNKDYKKWQADAAQYRSDVKKYRADVENFKQNLPEAKRRELDAYTAKLDAHNSRINKLDTDLKDFDKKWVKYENEMDNYKKQKYEWENNYKDKSGADFDAKQKKYEQDMAKYETEYESWSNKKSEYEGDRSDFAKKKKEYDADVRKETDFEITAEDKAQFYDWAKTKIQPEEVTPKKSFKDVAGEVKTEKKVIDAFEKPPEKPVAPTPEKPKKSFKDVAGEVKEKQKVIDAFEKPPEKPITPEPPKSAWESFKDGASNFFNWFKGSPVKKGAQMGTKIIHIKTQFYKGGKEVEYCDTDLEEDCEEKKIEVEEPAAPPKEERERSRPKESPDSSYRKVKDINFNDPNEILSAFINHKFEDKGLENIEDALILEKEWKSKVSGGIKSPSIVEYKKMQESGLFGKNPLMANIVYNIMISYRKINLANSLFPVAQAQDTSDSTTTPPSTPPSGGVSSKPKNTFEEETDDEEDAAARKARQEQKGKDAGIMVGSAGAGMIGGALVSLGLDKFKDAVPKLGKVVEKVRVFFGTSPGIAVLSGMSTLINGLTLGFVVEEKKAFEENVKKIKDIKSKFEEDMAEHCPAKKDRETQSKPQCYCYISGGQRNPLRRNSDICKSYYARFDGSFYVGAGSYEFKADSPVKGCVGIKGNYDFDCSCRRYKDRASGSNACMKINNSFEGLGNIGSSNSVGVLTTYGNDIASDPATIHRLDGEAVGRNAVKVKQASDQALLAFNKQRVANGEKPFSVGPKELENFTNKVMGLPESRGAIAALQEAKATPVRPPMALPKDLKLKEEKKMDLSKITYESAPKKKEEKKEDAKAKAPDWDFLAEEKKKEEVDFMAKSFDFEKGVKKKQIVEKEDTNIFNIISNRYIHTGLKLLFKEDEK